MSSMPTTGLDPEFFITTTRGAIVPASSFIPFKASLDYIDYPVAYDNAAVELRPPECACHAGLMTNTREVFSYAMAMMRKARLAGTIPSSSSITYAPAARLRKDAYETHPEVAEFGCSPSIIVNAAGEPVRSAPSPGRTPWRSAGFHIHLALDSHLNLSRQERYDGASCDHTTKRKIDAHVTRGVQIADVMLGFVDVMMNEAAGWGDEARARRQILGYGLPGEHRIRYQREATYNYEYPIFEYRTLSPWLLSSPIWTWWGTTSLRHIMSRSGLIYAGGAADRFFATLPSRDEVIRVIVENDAAQAYVLWKQAVCNWLEYACEINDAPDECYHECECSYLDSEDLDDGVTCDYCEWGCDCNVRFNSSSDLKRHPWQVEDGESEVNGLAYENLCRVLTAIDRGGHRFITGTRSWRSLWATGKHGIKGSWYAGASANGKYHGGSSLLSARYHSSLPLTRRTGRQPNEPWYAIRTDRHYAQRMCYLHDYGLERSFNTGFTMVMALDHSLDPIKDLSTFGPNFNHLRSA